MVPVITMKSLFLTTVAAGLVALSFSSAFAQEGFLPTGCLIEVLAAEGHSVIVVSSELPEVI